MAIDFEANTLCFQQRTLTAPSWGCPTFYIHNPMTRQFLCLRGISQCPSYHPRMTRPAGQGCDVPVGRHLSTRNLRDNVQHIVTKHPCLLRRHPIGVVLHALTFLLQLRFWQFLICLTNKSGQIVTVVDIRDVEIILCPFVRRTQIHHFQHFPTCLRRLQIETVVTDKSEYLSIAIDALIAKHFLGDNLPCPTTLVCDVLYKIRAACHK